MACSLNEHLQFGAAKCKNLTVSRLKDAETGHTSLTFMNYPERIFLDTHSRQDGQGCRKSAWRPENGFTLLEPKPASYDLQEHGEVQDGTCLICMDGSLRNIARQTYHSEVSYQNYSYARGFSEQEVIQPCMSTNETNW